MKISVIMILLLINTAAFAGKLEPVLVAPSGSAQSGDQIVFSVYLHNWTDDAVRTIIPESVNCQLQLADQTLEVTAISTDSTKTGSKKVRGKGFIRVQYTLSVPASVQGTINMSVPTFGDARVMFAVRAKDDLSPEKGIAEVDDKKTKYTSLDSLFALYQPYLGNIAAHEPMYFLVGTNPEDSKFQVSFKYRVLNPEGSIAKKYPWAKGFHFGYTQTSFWDLESASAPFEDTSYKPEFFFLSSNIDTGALGIKRLFLQAGFQHESNGRGGEFSRSANNLYVNPIFIFFDEESQFGFQISPKVWAYVSNDEDTNSDLEDYRGYFDLGLKFGKADGFVLGSHFGWAKEGGSVQVNLTYPVHRFLFNNLDVYLQAQYVNGLAESLLNYRERTEAFRIGLAIVR